MVEGWGRGGGHGQFGYLLNSASYPNTSDITELSEIAGLKRI